jgi:hypothetical protein
LLSNGAGSFVFQIAIQKYRYQDIKKHNFACVLFGCETWFLTLRGQHRLRVFEKTVLMKILGIKSEVVRGE